MTYKQHSRSRIAAGRAVLLLQLLMVGLAAATPSFATDIAVSTTDDEENVDGDCSLREAIRAANLNQARDACPAGSNTDRDTVTLQSGATYSLTVAGNDNDGVLGDLDIANNSAPLDLLIDVADGGTATISQDAFPDDIVFDVFSGTNLEIDDVAIRGGTSANGQSGGGVAVNGTASVTLKRCLLAENFSSNNGGAIANNGGTLALDGCVVTGNLATGSGGAIFSGTSATTVIRDTLFKDNVALSQGAGAIRTNGSLTVTSSSFVDNRAPGDGGAIGISSNGINLLSVTSSCFIGNSEVAVMSFSGSQQDATGNWWGAPDGPSAAGPGSGNGVSAGVAFSGFATNPLDECRPQELAANGGFEIDEDANLLPDHWRGRKLQLAHDGESCDGKECLFEIEGDGQRNLLIQTLSLTGPAGDTFTFGASSEAIAVPATGGRYLFELTLIHADGSTQNRSVKFSPGDHDPEAHSKQLIAREPYVRIKLRLEYGRPSGTARFDDVSVVLTK